jgi:ketosteroid isomerase-like protein
MEPRADGRYEEVRRVIRQVGVGETWKAVVDPDMPPHLKELTDVTLDAYGRGDLDWLLAQAPPDFVISQPADFPDFRTYNGQDALLEAMLDWPRQWEDFRMEPRRIFAEGDHHVVMVALHRGRSRAMDIEVEAEIVFLLRWRDGAFSRWDMFLSVDEALEAARAA